MSTDYIYEALPYSAAQVELITGLSTTMQRDWRRRKLVRRPRRSGSGAFPHEVAEILIIQALRDNMGLNLEIAAEHATKIAPIVLWFALRSWPAWLFDGTRDEATQFRKYIMSLDKLGLAYLGEMVGAPKDGFQWFSVWHGGKWTLTSDLKSIFDVAYDKEIGGIVLNHDALGQKMFEKVKRPIYLAKCKHMKGKRGPMARTFGLHHKG